MSKLAGRQVRTNFACKFCRSSRSLRVFLTRFESCWQPTNAPGDRPGERRSWGGDGSKPSRNFDVSCSKPASFLPACLLLAI